VLLTSTRTSALISMPIARRCSASKTPAASPPPSSSTVNSRRSTACSPTNIRFRPYVNKQDLLDAISRVALVAERNAPIRMTFTGQEVALSAGSVDEAQANETLDIDMDGDDITVAFNPSYLKEGLSAVTEPFVRIKMTTPVKPVEFNGQQEADSDESMDYRYLLVPMRFNN